ncbi:MAG: hypothetical protein GXP46_01830 [Deferribacteres bacterium]|nr:hypothetical protein [Deferribacteres bacterium]
MKHALEITERDLRKAMVVANGEELKVLKEALEYNRTSPQWQWASDIYNRLAAKYDLYKFDD